MILRNDPIKLQRILFSHEDPSEFLINNKYHFVNAYHEYLKVAYDTRNQNEDRIQELTKKLESIFKECQKNPHMSQVELYKTYEKVRDLQQEKLIRYCLSDKHLLLIDSLVIPLGLFRLTRISRMFQCRDLVFLMVLYFYEGNYESLLNVVERRFTHLEDFVSKLYKGNGSIEEYLALSQLSEEGEEEDDFEEENVYTEEFSNEELPYELHSESVREEVKWYWICNFLKILIHFKLSQFERVCTEFDALLDCKPIDGQDAISIFQTQFDENGIVTKKEMAIIITLSMLIVTPIRELKKTFENEKLIKFFECVPDSTENLIKVIRVLVDCQFPDFNRMLVDLIDQCGFQMTKNTAKVEVILRQEQYLLILSSMSKISVTSFSQLLGIDAELVEYEVVKLIEFLNLRVDHSNDGVFELRQKIKDTELLDSIKNLNKLYKKVSSTLDTVKQFDSIYG